MYICPKTTIIITYLFYKIKMTILCKKEKYHDKESDSKDGCKKWVGFPCGLICRFIRINETEASNYYPTDDGRDTRYYHY